MLIKAILVALLATGSQWWFSHLITRTWLYPIWSGFLTGVIMGEPVLGMQAAAYIQLTYLGWITAGGSMPGNLMVAGIYGTALTVLSGADPKLAVSFAVTLSLLGILINQAYMTLNSVWVHRADKYLEDGIAMLLNYLGKKKLIAFFFFGFFATVYLKLDTMSLFIFSAVIAAVMYFFSRDREEGGA